MNAVGTQCNVLPAHAQGTQRYNGPPSVPMPDGMMEEIRKRNPRERLQPARVLDEEDAESGTESESEDTPDLSYG